MRAWNIVLPFALFAILSGCGPQTRRMTGEEDIRANTRAFTSSDIDILSKKMFDKMMADAGTRIQAVGDKRTEKRASIVFGRIRNKTSDETIDVEHVNGTLMTLLVNSGHFAVLDASVRNDLADEVAFQQKMADPESGTAKQFAKQIGADYMLYGYLTSSGARTRTGVFADYDYLLNLVNVQTGVLEWSARERVRKGTQ